MKKLKILFFVIAFWFIGGCGGDSYVDETTYNQEYDMWEYMTPSSSYDIEYVVYEDGKETDYFYETTKVFSSDLVERVSRDDRTVLKLYEDSIRVEEPNGEVVQVQRYVKIGDDNIFQSSSIRSCKADDYFRSIVIKGVEFYRVIKVSCLTNSGSSEIYYGYDEGIVSIYRNENGSITEIVKVDEKRLQ
ncbi:MAG: hypothetical protein GXO60_03140 [Epsilonproteobacteria bacterium]|nr:hypothetical protein [Campylobacterota bacterium]